MKNDGDTGPNTLSEIAEAKTERGHDPKTKYISVNCDPDQINAQSGKVTAQVDDFVYLGCHLDSSEHDFMAGKAQAWAVCHQMRACGT